MIMLTDSNDNPPIFMQHSYTSLIDEGVTVFEPPLIVQVNINMNLLRINMVLILVKNF